MKTAINHSLAKAPTAIVHLKRKPINKLFVNTTDCVHVIPFEKILYLEGEGNYCRFHLKDGSRILVAKTLKHYQSLLPSDQYLRVHKRYLVNIEHVNKIKKTPRCELVIDEQHAIPVSNSCKRQVYAVFST